MKNLIRSCYLLSLIIFGLGIAASFILLNELILILLIISFWVFETSKFKFKIKAILQIVIFIFIIILIKTPKYIEKCHLNLESNCLRYSCNGIIDTGLGRFGDFGVNKDKNLGLGANCILGEWSL